MSFAAEVRRELSEVSSCSASPCCMRAEGYGMLLGAEISARRIRLVSESIDSATRFARLLDRLCRVPVEVSASGAGYAAEAAEEAAKVLDFFYVDPGALARRLSRANLEEECCPAAFLRGLFLACGYITSPEKGYRLEFVTRHKRLSDDLATLLRERGFSPSVGGRRGMRVIYFKSGEAVEGLLALMGAPRSAAVVAEARSRKAVLNNVNRQMNTDTANIQKSLTAALMQVEAIAKLRRTGAFDFLPEELLAIAVLREQNPDATLGYLAELAGLPRSTVNRRLLKLRALADAPLKP
ncbi:MAG TPA: DNA-binding protein WhiA [Terriglobales bacterium]|nr:DNA-binding protein WhiA [Terriglobales bacterium]